MLPSKTLRVTELETSWDGQTPTIYPAGNALEAPSRGNSRARGASEHSSSTPAEREPLQSAPAWPLPSGRRLGSLSLGPCRAGGASDRSRSAPAEREASRIAPARPLPSGVTGGNCRRPGQQLPPTRRITFTRRALRVPERQTLRLPTFRRSELWDTPIRGFASCLRLCLTLP